MIEIGGRGYYLFIQIPVGYLSVGFTSALTPRHCPRRAFF
jgi:hypothetical protein